MTLPRRSLVSLALALALPAAACTDAPPTGPRVAAMARDLGSDVVRALVRGHVPGRSGDVALVPAPWNVLSQWNGGLRDGRDPRTSHASPWSYHQRVPLTLFGPGYIRSGVRPDRAVDLADLAPTLAALMRFRGWEAPAGRVLREALLPAGRRPDRPRVIVVVVYDGGGWNLLSQWPTAWPVQHRLAERGTTFLNATIGSAPSITAPIHMTIGSGAYPRTHGIPENTARLPNGSIGEIYLHRGDPRLMRAETVADAWDLATGNRAWVGMLGYESWHLGMMGAGATVPGGDRDVAVLWDTKREAFWTNEEAYRLPEGLPTAETLGARMDALDATDGARDGSWRGNELAADAYWYDGLPAFAAYQSDAVLEMLRREPIGRDRVTDLLFVEMKAPDLAGHVWNMSSPEESDVLRTIDRELLGRLVAELDRRVGRGQYVLGLTADHGQSPIPETKDALRIDRFRLAEDINGHFQAPVVEAVHPSELYVHAEVLEELGVDLEAVARYVGGYRYGDGLPEGIDPASLPPEVRDRRVFAAALPATYIEGLTASEIEALGPGRFPEGNLTVAPRRDPLVG